MANIDIEEYVKKNLPDWTLIENKLIKELKTKNWLESMLLANMISYLAEKHNHHPDLIVKYTSIRIELFTHTAREVTQKDLQLAQKINELLSES